MCLIFIAWQMLPQCPLLLAANRDEFYRRPTAAADFWPQAPQVLGGRDLEGGGSWLGVTRSGRLAAITNYRNLAELSGVGADKRSRGLLVSDFLTGSAAAADYLAELAQQPENYRGFNLLVGDGDGLHYYSNRGAAPRPLAPGLYGLSNHLLDTPWPKVAQGKRALAQLLRRGLPSEAELFELLAERTIAPDSLLPETGLSRDWERLLSARFIHSADYGTRASTLVLVDGQGGVRFSERSFTRQGALTAEVRKSLIFDLS
jgi:uncharacterized protein with NRDE domain